MECAKYGIPDNQDVEDVWGEIIDKPGLEDYFGQFKKLIWNSQVTVRHMGENKPLTALHLTFGRIRLWIDENISACYNKEKVEGIHVTSRARHQPVFETIRLYCSISSWRENRSERTQA